MTAVPFRQCGACLDDTARPTDFAYGTCPTCGLRTDIAVDAGRYQPVVIPSPRAVPPASGLRRILRHIA